MYFSLFNNTARFGDDGGYESVVDVFTNGAPYALVGILTVFSVLAIIWGVLELFHLLSHGKKKKNDIPTPVTVTEPQPVLSLPCPESKPVANDEEIVAVIAAAIAAAQNENPIGSFRVVSFKRK